MAKWLFLAHTNCKDPAREAEFNEWYDKVHIPDILKGLPEFLKATRYEAHGSSKTPSKYVAVYEIESSDIEQTMARLWENVRIWSAQGRMSDLTVMVQQEIYCQMGQ